MKLFPFSIKIWYFLTKVANEIRRTNSVNCCPFFLTSPALCFTFEARIGKFWCIIVKLADEKPEE